ncbi:hypothetical protein [Euzebya pacifica]|uniref:hypothetical protein n=1 Tax=Euzebya pacifica TaxID=1608957 RepID=UPI0030F7C38C
MQDRRFDVARHELLEGEHRAVGQLRIDAGVQRVAVVALLHGPLEVELAGRQHHHGRRVGHLTVDVDRRLDVLSGGQASGDLVEEGL